MFYGNLVQLSKKSNSVIRSRSVMVKNWCNVLSMEGVTVCGHHPECRVTFGRGGPLPKIHNQNEISVTNQIEYTGFRQDSYL